MSSKKMKENDKMNSIILLLFFISILSIINEYKR
jgi:hypothetical protein